MKMKNLSILLVLLLVVWSNAFLFSKQKKTAVEKNKQFEEKIKNIQHKLSDKTDKIVEKLKNKKNRKKILGADNDKYVPQFSPLLYVENQAEQLAERFGSKDEFVEGDMKYTGPVIAVKNGKSSRREVLNQDYRWPTTTIPYTLDASLGSSARGAISSAIKDFTDYTSIKFIPRTTETDYINIYKGIGCWSYVGRTEGKQDLSIGTGCGYKGTVIHELMHALGFFHEHTRTDRDNFIKVQFGNVQSDKVSNFNKYTPGTASTFDFPYDFDSIMHYGTRAFSKNLLSKTIIPVDASIDQSRLGQRSGLSITDAEQIKKAYDDVTTTPVATTEKLTTPVVTTVIVTTPIATTAKPVTTANPAATTTLATTERLTTTTVKATTSNVTPDAGGTKAITLIPGGTPTRIPTTTIKKNTTTTAAPPPDCSPTFDYPCWPQDFVWSSSGLPPSCNCNPNEPGRCRCTCVRIQGSKRNINWNNNFLCFKDHKKDPNFKWSTRGDIPSKTCVKFDEPGLPGWEKNYLCTDKNVPYQFKWSNNGPLKDMACMNINEPEDQNWLENYLCSN